MSLGLAASPPPGIVGRSFVRAEHAAALLCLLGALIVTLAMHLTEPDLLLWPAAVALLPTFGALVLLDRLPTLVSSVVYLVVGTLGVYGYTATYALVMGVPDPIESAVLALPILAVILVGGPGHRPIEISGWGTTAFALALGSSLAARQAVGAPLAVDMLVLFAYPVSIAILLLVREAARGTESTRATLHRAAREDAMFAARVREEARATAVIHDTVLNHLAVVAASPSGPLSQDLRAQVEQDIASLDADDWFGDAFPGALAGHPDHDRSRGLHSSPGLQGALDAGVALGLTVEPTGRMSDLALLTEAQDRALGLAVTQCLVNVQQHSGTRRAEVAVGAVAGELVAMVIDTGRGFDVGDVSSDRMGLRNSVRARIEAVGGSAAIWSSPGLGTSVVIRFPTGSAPTGSAPTGSAPTGSAPTDPVSTDAEATDPGPR